MAAVIGVVSGLMTIFTFLSDNFSYEDELTGSQTTMRIVAGLDGTEGLSNAGGDYPDVRLFGENGEFLGAEYDPGYVEDGTHYDVTIQQTSEQQPTYALFTGNTDAICIAYIFLPLGLTASSMAGWAVGAATAAILGIIASLFANYGNKELISFLGTIPVSHLVTSSQSVSGLMQMETLAQ